MRVAGADGASFDTICAADAAASVPHAIPGERRLVPDGAVLFDWGARLDGYCSDLTRVYCTGRIAPNVGDLAQIVLEAQAAVLDVLKPGNRCCDADAAGRAVIAKAGHGHHFGHGVGHGVGLLVHEAPHLAPGVETVLLPGMVVTVEPAVYLPGEAGVRIEDMALITSDGCEVLSSLARTPVELQST
jgi:Xaa-Pro aminopeptidase